MKKYKSVSIDSNFIYSTLGFKPPAENVLYRAFRVANEPPFSDWHKNGDMNSVVFVIAYETYTLVTPTKVQSHRLADIAIKNGSTLLVTNTQINEYPCLVVPDVIDALHTMISAFFDNFNPPTIAITGSIGKTTTKNFVHTLLSGTDTLTFPSERGNANDIRGVVNSCCVSNIECDFLVKEVMEGPPAGTAKIISEIIKPDIAIITKTSNSHIEYFDSIESIFNSALEIQNGMPNDGILLLNGDDCYQANAVTKLKKMYYAIENKNAEFLADNIELSAQGTSFDLIHDNQTSRMHINYIGKHNVYNALSAIAAAKLAGVSDEVIRERLLLEKPTDFRQNILEINGYTLYMDCFNASEDSMYSSLESLKLFHNKRKIAVIGDITELGQLAKAVHARIGKYISRMDIDELICFGKNSAYIAEYAMPNKAMRVFHTTKRESVVEALISSIAKGDVVLFKASRAMKLETIANEIFGTDFGVIK